MFLTQLLKSGARVLGGQCASKARNRHTHHEYRGRIALNVIGHVVARTLSSKPKVSSDPLKNNSLIYSIVINMRHMPIIF